MTNSIDHQYFQELANAAPGQICRNGRCRFDPVSCTYSLDIWGEEYILDCAGKKIACTGTAEPKPHEYFYLFVIYYLLSAQDIQVKGEWISEKDVPGGTTFFRGPHLIPTDLISSRFGNDLERFKKCCRDLGGTSLNLADAAFRFDITPDLPVAVLLWQGDEDFPAEAGILYDRSITTLLSLDILFALAVAICFRVGKAGQSGMEV
ncbi:MAG: hypothetical protein VR65_18765 [Desulfobulbaceae bacterium BRH_c16a]|nr:MAG: hypothetical protein VR65_18765 [Desulfobulbaceae bacterium BRH_c16a]